jgi:hypothetical protein
MEKKGNKTYYFTATLSPTEYCKDFNPGELNLGDGYRFDIFFNGVTIWNPNIKAKFVKVSPFVKEAFDILISAFMFREYIISKRVFKLSLNMQRCIEAMNVRAESNLIWTLDYPGQIYTPNTKARVNVTWRRVANFFSKFNASVHHRIMLKDFRDSITSAGDNAFFFAYRIIDDIRRAINLEKVGVDNEKDWSQMHSALKTNKMFMEPLILVGTKVRHGDLNSSLVVNARNRNKKNKILNIAIDLLKREFIRKFPGFLN